MVVPEPERSLSSPVAAASCDAIYRASVNDGYALVRALDQFVREALMVRRRTPSPLP
jgi:hypothetical protein